MSEYPDPDEEYELMYSDDLDLLREIEDDSGQNTGGRVKKSFQAKRSLDFSSPVAKNVPSLDQTTNIEVSSVHNNETSISLTPSLQALDDVPTPNVSNKRTVEDLFGDINDLDFDNIELPSKRQKTEEENDMDLINKIIEGRKLKQILNEPSARSFQEKKSNYNAKDNITYNAPKWPFIAFTNWNGERVYVRIEVEDDWDNSLNFNTEKVSLGSTYSSVWEEARKILEMKQQQKETTQPIQEDVTNNVVSELWVEKYRPKCYVDLLSEEPVNRALLHWLHLWDKVVFKKEYKIKEPQQCNTFVKRTGQFQLSNKWKGKKENESELDEDGRPHHKVALLCGPPGAGKTTLAHLLARLAGYRPVELNASDERSTEAFQTALQSATLMRSVLDTEKRPNCLILDEIDGAPIQTVELLVKWCTAVSHKKEDGKKKTKSQPLRRPVIAICNDLYATSLRPLRPVALQVSVGSVTSCRLLSRLRAVSRAERLHAAPRALALLASRAAGDVRAAIHALCFVKGSQITIEDIEKVPVGTKDHTKSMMQALQAVFTINDSVTSDIVRTIQAAGEYDRLAEGIFQNYLSARVDARLLIACETLSWLKFYDIVNSWILRNQNYSVYSILPLCIARCHAILASRQGLKVKFPMQAQEVSRKKAELDSILQSVWRGTEPHICTSRTALRLDILPLLPYLLNPKLRSANVQLCSDAERRAVTACASTMCDYGLQYTQQRGLDGLYTHVIEPDVYKISFFGPEERIKPPPAIRQAIAREQQLEVIRRNEEIMNRSNKNQEKKTKTETKTLKTNEQRIPNHLQRLQPKVVTRTVPQVQKDFFGRIVPVAQVQKQDAVADVISSSSVFYQYREGFNNAVRRNVRVRDLF